MYICIYIIYIDRCKDIKIYRYILIIYIYVHKQYIYIHVNNICICI